MGTEVDEVVDSHGAVDRNRSDANLVWGVLRTTKPAILRDNIVISARERKERVLWRIFRMARKSKGGQREQLSDVSCQVDYFDLLHSMFSSANTTVSAMYVLCIVMFLCFCSFCCSLFCCAVDFNWWRLLECGARRADADKNGRLLRPNSFTCYWEKTCSANTVFYYRKFRCGDHDGVFPLLSERWNEIVAVGKTLMTILVVQAVQWKTVMKSHNQSTYSSMLSIE